MILKTVTLNYELVNYIQRIFYDLKGYENIVTTIMRDRSQGIEFDKELYSKFMTEYKELNLSYRYAMEEVFNMHRGELSSSNVTYSLDFSTGIFTISGGASSCTR